MRTASKVFMTVISVAALTLQSRQATGGQGANLFADTKALRVLPERLHAPAAILAGGWLLDSTVTLNWDGSAWQFGGATRHTYHQNGTGTSDMIQVRYSTAWVNSNLDSSTFDTSGHQTTSLELYWSNGAWVLGTQDTFAYDTYGYRTSTLERTWNGAAWVNSIYDSYTNDASGRPTVDVNQKWTGNAWVNVQRLSYTYNIYEKQTYVLMEKWNGSAWQNYGQEFVTLGANGQRSNVLQQAWQNNAWVNYAQDNYSYDGNGHQTLDVNQSWTGGTWVNNIQWTSTYDGNGNKSQDLEQDWYNNSWRNSELYQITWEKAGAIAVVAPVQGETVLAGSLYEIQWRAPGSNAVNIDLSLDSGRTFEAIAYQIPAENTYAWRVPDTLAAKCRIRVVDIEDSTQNGQSAQFRIKPYVLTRFKPNGDYERYDPAIHGWRFRNIDTLMWPESWWKRFNYAGIDPVSVGQYNRAFWRIPEESYPDWPLFVRAFGLPNCYSNFSPVVYSRRAFRFWDRLRHGFLGACFGFSVSSLLDFDNPGYLKANYPELGEFAQVNDIALSDSSRLIVNLYQQYLWGYARMQYYVMHYSDTPRQMLEALKAMFMSDIRNHQAISLDNLCKEGGHNIVPYALERGSGTGKINVLVYDCNPYPGNSRPALTIDSLNNVWRYDPLNWPESTEVVANRGCILECPVNTFMLPPVMYPPRSTPGERAPEYSTMPFDAGSASVMIFPASHAAISITDAAQHTIGFHGGTVVNTFPQGVSIFPDTSRSGGPLGYFVPSGSYGIHASSFADTSATIAIFDSLRVFSYWRGDANSSQTDNLTYGNGLDVGNPDPQAKTISLETVLTLAATERSFQVSNCSLVHADSLRISAPDSGQLKLINLGSQKTYDLSVVTGGPGVAGTYTHTGVTLPSHSTHYILPYWPDLHQSLRIMEDVGNTGKISDTLTLADQTTGINGPARSGIPSVFSLEQNYPNPFNPTTVVRYQLPVVSHVTLVVFDILGREVTTLVNEVKQPGTYTVRFDGSGLASGVYFYRLQARHRDGGKAGDFVEMKKLLLLR